MISTGIDVAEILKCIKEKFKDNIGSSSFQGISYVHYCPAVVHTLALNALPYAEGASWDSSRVCLPQTRTTMLDDIWTWANNLNTTHIFWLADVRGAGK